MKTDIRNGTLWIDGKQVENTGSTSICAYCKKAYNCKAFQDNYKLTVNHFGAPAEVTFKALHQISQICACPIGEFEYKKIIVVDEDDG